MKVISGEKQKQDRELQKAGCVLNGKGNAV